MNFDQPRPPEVSVAHNVQRLADAAQEWARSLDLARFPTAHVVKALQGVPEGRERDRLFGAILRELRRREREELSLREEVRERSREEHLRQAYAHERRQPRDAWDSQV